MMSEYVKQVQLAQTIPIADTMRRIKESIGLPLTPYPNISYLNKKMIKYRLFYCFIEKNIV